MFSWYLVLKFIHIASAIVAVGSNITYGVWSVRGSGEPAHMAFALKGIKFLDDRIANPAYGVLLLTGLIMMFTGGFGRNDIWLPIAIALFIAIVVLGLAFYSPLLKNQIRLAEAGDTSSPEYSRLANLSRRFGPGLGVIVVVILALMVFKPHL
jgi:uncharacterized membrane protein